MVNTVTNFATSLKDEEEDHAEQKQQMVIAGEHVARAQADVLQVATVEHALAVRFGDAMGHGYHRDQQEQGRGELLQKR
jgi:hypothetical protein